ncbi:MAG: CDP-alcohol phosphatidyltransferase family protein [Acidimicrobiia bacterium]
MDDRRVLTVPNAISVIRLLCAPLFLWLLFEAEERAVTFGLLAVLGATDWVDGWIARRFDQGSLVGKVLDPVADRILLLTAAIALTIDGVVPTWVGVLVLVREALVSAATLALAVAGAARIDVQWAGKAGTFALMFALPGFLLVDVLDPGTGRDAAQVTTWVATAGGLVLGYLAVAQYVPIARDALRAGRSARAGTSGAAV